MPSNDELKHRQAVQLNRNDWVATEPDMPVAPDSHSAVGEARSISVPRVPASCQWIPLRYRVQIVTDGDVPFGGSSIRHNHYVNDAIADQKERGVGKADTARGLSGLLGMHHDIGGRTHIAAPSAGRPRQPALP